MKKKILAAFVCAAMVLSLTACGSKDDPFANLPQNSAGSNTSAPNTNSKPANSSKTDAANSAAESKPEESSEPPSSNVADFAYTEEDGKITITRYMGSDTAVVFPKTIDGKPVVAIGANENNYNSFYTVVEYDVESVVIPNGVTKINSVAFYNCSKLADITIPESVTDIGNSSFYATAWLKKKREENPLVIVNNIVIDGQTCTRSVEIPEGVKAIADYAFSNCTTLTNITLPKSLEKIGEAAFFNCSRLNDIVFPDKISSIGDIAFCACEALENVTFPNSTVEMGGNVFGNDYFGYTPWLKNMQAADPLVIINDYLIDGKKCTGDVVIPDSVKSIACNAFEGNGKMKSVKLPNGITKIPSSCFYECHVLENITIPNSVTEIGDRAFLDSGIKNITIPNGVTKIGSYAFATTYGTWISRLESVTLPDTLTEIGESAFSYCDKLTSITIPDGVTHIGNYTFSICNKLTNVTISDSVTHIGANAFAATNIKSVTLPDNIKSYDKSAFEKADITYRGEIYFPELYDELIADIEKNNS